MLLGPLRSILSGFPLRSILSGFPYVPFCRVSPTFHFVGLKIYTFKALSKIIFPLEIRVFGNMTGAGLSDDEEEEDQQNQLIEVEDMEDEEEIDGEEEGEYLKENEEEEEDEHEDDLDNLGFWRGLGVLKFWYFEINILK